jgi:hypothetical protein
MRWERRARRPPLSCSLPHRGWGFGLLAEGGFEPSRNQSAPCDFRDRDEHADLQGLLLVRQCVRRSISVFARLRTGAVARGP